MTGGLWWVVWTALFWAVCVVVLNLLEATVHRYSTRVVAMFLTGVLVGGAAALVGYQFFLLAGLLLVRVWRQRMALVAAIRDGRQASKYALPSALLILAATLSSFVLSVETCSESGNQCSRLFPKLSFVQG